MKSCVILLALLQSLYCSGLPVYNSETAVMAERGLGAALSEVNTVYAGSHLYRVTKGSLKRVIPVAVTNLGQTVYDLLLSFGVRESACLKSSREDPQGCAFRPGFFLPSYSCVSRVRVSAASTQVVALRCGHGTSSSSSESSEEIFSRGRQHVNIPSFSRDPPAAPQTPPPPPPPPASPGRSAVRQDVEVTVPRGDIFTNNYLI